MRRRTYLSLTGLAAAGGLAGCSTTGGDGGGNGGSGGAGGAPGSAGGYVVETAAEGFRSPWGLEHLPDGTTLVTERVGGLKRLDRESGSVTEIDGTPEVYASGQGGLLDVAHHPDYPDEPWVYLTYSVAGDGGTSTTRLGRGRLPPGETSLRRFETLYTAEPFVESDGHFGSRVGFDPDGFCYVTVGDRQFKNFGPEHVAQDRSNDLGTTLRLRPDGSIPDDNPFVEDEDARDAIYSWGHRNAQGLTVHPETGAVWESEFGEQDGDEINVIERGANYGWPVADEGCTYGEGEPIGVSHDDRADVTAPVYSWPCGSGGFPPSGTTFYDGDAFPEWQGNLLVGGLASQYLGRFEVDGRDVTETDGLLTDRDWRVRDVAVAPDTGYVYVAIDATSAPVVRLVPE